MATFVVKPVEVEAVQFSGDLAELQAFAAPRTVDSLSRNFTALVTPRGRVPIGLGDWLVRDAAGALTVVPRDGFFAVYDFAPTT